MDLQDKEIKKSIEELMTLMQDHVNKDKEKAEITRILLSSDRDIIRCQITEIYYHYCTEKKLPVYERENLVYLQERYIQLEGNSYIKTIYEAMMKWEVVYEIMK